MTIRREDRLVRIAGLRPREADPAGMLVAGVGSTAYAGTVAVFAASWGAPSEVFIRRQISSMARYRGLPLALSRWPATPRGAAFVLGDERPTWHLICRIWMTNRLPGRRPLHMTPAWVPLAGVCRQSGVCLIHAHFGPTGLVATPLARALRVPLVVTFHGFDVTSFPRLPSYRDDYRRFLFPQADALLAVSDFVRGRLEKLGVPRGKPITHYMGVPLETFTPRTDHSPRTTLRLLSVGRLVEGKGHKYLFAAAVLLCRKRLPISLTIVGDGPSRASLESLARSSGISHLVRFAGWQQPHVVSEAMRRADVFVMPSITTEEGSAEAMGLAHLEAAASGLPVVASRVGGIPEGVVDGVTGFLVEEKDPVSLAERVALLARCPDMRRRMGAAGRTLVEDRFDLAKQTARLEDIYDEVLASYRDRHRLGAEER